MKLGMPTLIEFDRLEQNLHLCRRLGLDFIELNMNVPLCMPENLHDEEIKRMRKEYGVEFTVHLPEELDLSSLHPAMRAGHLQRCMETMEWACRAEIRTLNMHFNQGVYFTLPHKKVWIYEQYEAEFMQATIESFSKLSDLAVSFGLELCIENTGNFHIPFVRKALNKIMDLPGFRLTWDAGHDAKAEFQETPLFMRLIDRIGHMHLHDYNGKSDHQPLYSGIVPVDERLRLAEERGWTVVIEVKTGESLEESVRRLGQRGRR